MEVVLLTGTIQPHCKIEHNDVLVRAMEYEHNIEKYIKETDFDKIIFAENSGYFFRKEYFENMVLENGKEFEYIDVSSTAETGNISIGDAKIMLDAINNSRILKGEQSLWKVSGRIWINNINTVLRTQNGENVFLYSPKYDSIQTWFFKAEIDTLKKFFLRDEIIEKMKATCIEYAWKDCWETNKSEISLQRFSTYPDARGINSSGNKYNVNFCMLFLKNLLLKLGHYTVKERRSKNAVDKRDYI